MTDSEDQLIDKYIRGDDLTPSEKTLLESKMLENDFLDAIADRQQIIAGLRSVDAAHMKSFLKQTEVDLQTSSRTKPLNGVVKLFSILALVIIAIITYYYVKNETISHDTLYASYYKTYPNTIDPLTKGSNTELSVFQAYEQGNYEAVISTLSSKAVLTPDEQYYLAMTYLEKENYQQAEAELTKITNPQYESSKNWYLALLCLKKNNDQCSALFSAIEKSSNSPYKDKAGKILLALE